MLLLIICLVFPLQVHAQTEISLNSMTIEIWPEYDQPGVLVIYQLVLSPAATLPATLTLRIPTSAGAPNAVAEKQTGGSLYNITSTRQVEGDWAAITFTTTSSEVQLEYYDHGLTKEGSNRHYQFIWPGDYAITQLTISVQQPWQASDMRIAPSLGAGVVGTDGLTYYTEDIGAITAGQNIQITLDYQKATDALSVENLPIQPSAPISQSSSNDINFSTWLPWILGILGAGLIIGGIFWYWQTGRQRPARQARRRRTRIASPLATEGSSGSEEVDIYCSQCGKRASPGDQFCRSCGSPLRSK
jgi:hypothetical protein